MPNYKDFDLDIQKKKDEQSKEILQRGASNASECRTCQSLCPTSCRWAGTACAQ